MGAEQSQPQPQQNDPADPPLPLPPPAQAAAVAPDPAPLIAAPHKYDPERFTEPVDESWICAICTEVPVAPPNLPCGHLFCQPELRQLVKKQCPTCRISSPAGGQSSRLPHGQHLVHRSQDLFNQAPVRSGTGTGRGYSSVSWVLNVFESAI